MSFGKRLKLLREENYEDRFEIVLVVDLDGSPNLLHIESKTTEIKRRHYR